MNRITRNSFNGNFFYQMQKSELEYCIGIIKEKIDSYKRSTSGVCISDQEAQAEYWSALQNANFNLNKFI
jgi:hypothetical protein